MNTLFLASEINIVIGHIVPKLPKPPQQLKTAFIYTGGEQDEDKTWIDVNRQGFIDAGFDWFDYTLSGKTPKDLEKDLGSCDMIHLNGGNSFYLLLQAKKSGFIEFIHRQVANGVIYTGSSGGSIVAAKKIRQTEFFEETTYEAELNGTTGIGLVDILIMPHWGSQDFKDTYLKQRLDVAYRPENKIILLNDFQYLEVRDENYKIIDIRID